MPPDPTSGRRPGSTARTSPAARTAPLALTRSRKRTPTCREHRIGIRRFRRFLRQPPRREVTMAPLRIATRGSRLALWQAERVAALLGGDAELVVVSTTGDQRTDVPISTIGGTGVFVKEVQQAVLDGRAELAVHSAKDLPSATADGLVLAAVPERADPRDALVGARLDGIPAGGRIGTGSVRRQAQLAALRPDLRFESPRGSIETRVAKAADLDAVVVALAALERLRLADRIARAPRRAGMGPQGGQCA